MNKEQLHKKPEAMPNMGLNIKIARATKGFSQEGLGSEIKKTQKDISLLEQQTIIEDEVLLQKLANALDCDINFLKEFVVENAMRTYNQYDTTIEVKGAANSQDNVLNQGEQEITNNYNFPVDQFKELYERVITLSADLAVKANENSRLQIENEELTKEIEKLRKELNRFL